MDNNTVWNFEFSPLDVLRFTTFLNLTLYLVFFLFAMWEEHVEKYPSMSWMIAYSSGTTASFTIMVFIHGYTISSYLVIASGYIGYRSQQFKAIAVSSFVYWLSLIMITYMPLSRDENPHNIAALVAFFSATASVYLHRQTNDLDLLLLTELMTIVIVTLLGVLFWFFDKTVAEYIFIPIIMVDKYLKVSVMQRLGLIDLSDSKVRYSYITPSIRTTTQANYF